VHYWLLLLLLLLLLQVVAAVATLTKATQQLSSDVKSKMLSVVATSITCAKVNKQQMTSDEATRMMAVVAAGHGVKSSVMSAAANSAAGGGSRHLLSLYDQLQAQSDAHQPKCQKDCGEHANSGAAAATSSSSYWDGSNGSRYQLFGGPPRSLLEGTTAFAAPAFLATAQTIAALLTGAASPGSGYLSGGDNGLYVSVANQLGRSYSSGSGVAVGPVLTGTGGVAAATSGSNAVVSFSQPLTSSCVDENGALDPNNTCRCGSSCLLHSPCHFAALATCLHDMLLKLSMLPGALCKLQAGTYYLVAQLYLLCATVFTSSVLSCCLLCCEQ
jgi:hypothetical protein